MCGKIRPPCVLSLPTYGPVAALRASSTLVLHCVLSFPPRTKLPPTEQRTRSLNPRIHHLATVLSAGACPSQMVPRGRKTQAERPMWSRSCVNLRSTGNSVKFCGRTFTLPIAAELVRSMSKPRHHAYDGALLTPRSRGEAPRSASRPTRICGRPPRKVRRMRERPFACTGWQNGRVNGR